MELNSSDIVCSILLRILSVWYSILVASVTYKPNAAHRCSQCKNTFENI